MNYSKEFFDLQLRFAERITQLTQQPLSEAVANYTAFYLLFNLENAFDWEHPIWKRYVAGLNQVEDVGEWTYEVYQLQQEKQQISDQQYWGCFSYGYHAGDRRIIRLHFANRDESGQGPLSSQRQFARIAELRTMFLDIKNTTPEAQLVWGETWLYNRQQYTRLFPPEYAESAQPVEAGFQYRALWGQFVTSNGQLQTQLASTFLKNLAGKHDINNLGECFPLQILKVQCNIAAFYSFYGV